LYLSSVFVLRLIVAGPDFSMHSAHVMRSTYLVLIGYLVGFIGEHELSAKRRLIEMVSIQREVGRSRSAFVTLARLLGRIVRFFDADYALLQLRGGRAAGRMGRLASRTGPASGIAESRAASLVARRRTCALVSRQPCARQLGPPRRGLRSGPLSSLHLAEGTARLSHLARACSSRYDPLARGRPRAHHARARTLDFSKETSTSSRSSAKPQ
jgi:hypothetical protein